MTAYVYNEKIIDDYILILNICVTINSFFFFLETASKEGGQDKFIKEDQQNIQIQPPGGVLPSKLGVGGNYKQISLSNVLLCLLAYENDKRTRPERQG